MKPVYISEPAFLADLLFTYIIHFHDAQQMQKFINPDHSQEYLSFYNEIDKQFAVYPYELYPFFYPKDNGACFATVEIVCKDTFFQDYSFQHLCCDLQDVDVIKNDLIQYYFPDLDGLTGYDQIALIRRVTASDYPDSLRMQIVNFILCPTTVMDVFINDLRIKEKKLRKYYFDNEKLITRFNSHDWHMFSSKLLQVPNKPVDIQKGQVQYSTCLLRRNLNFARLVDGVSFTLFGIDYERYMDYLIAQNEEFDLESFGRAIGDAKRAQIYKLLCEGSSNTSTIAKAVEVSLTSVLYHLNIMVEANVLGFYAVGKAVNYFLKTDYVNKAIHYFITSRENTHEEVEKAYRQDNERV